MVKIGGIYKHYKGNMYKVLTIATHTENGEEMVVYEALYDDHKVWVRPKNNFEEVVNKNNQVHRFELVE